MGIFSAAVAVQNADQPANDPPKEPVQAVGDGSPKWWKGNLHTHSLWSDGDDFPEMIADWYKQHGYHFLALSEHNVIAEGEKWVPADANPTRTRALAKYRTRFGERWVEQREKDGKKLVRLKPLSEFRSLLEEACKFLMIPAEESTHSFAKRPVHINGVNLRDVVKPIDGRDVDTCIYCAGIGEPLDLGDPSVDADVLRTNLVGVAITVAIVIPRMVARGTGHFIGLSSQADRLIDDFAPSYAASKAGMSSYLEGLALACKKRGVAITASSGPYRKRRFAWIQVAWSATQTR